MFFYDDEINSHRKRLYTLDLNKQNVYILILSYTIIMVRLQSKNITYHCSSYPVNYQVIDSLKSFQII